MAVFSELNKRYSKIHSNSWIVSPTWDLAFLTNGLWLFPIMYLLADSHNVGSWPKALALVGLMHLFSPLLMTYFFGPVSSSIPQVKKSILIKSIVIAVLSMSLIFVGLLQVSGESTPWRKEGISALIIAGVIYFIWNTWHACGQIYGILSLYRIRAGRNSYWEIFFDKWFCRLMLCACVPLAFLIGSDGDYILPVKKLFPNPLIVPKLFFVILFGVVFAALLARELYLKTTWPRLFFLSNILLIPFVGLFLGTMYFGVLLNVSHWIADVALASLVASRHFNASNPNQNVRPKYKPRMAFVGFLAIFALIAFFYLKLGCGSLGMYCANRIHMIEIPHLSFSSTILLSFIFGTHYTLSLLHFFTSGHVYRMADQNYGKQLKDLILQ